MEGCTNQLDPLLRGEPVFLSISDPRLRKKRRVSQPMLIIHPFSEDGAKVDKLLFSFPGYGCELLPVDDVKAERLYMMGLTFRSAKLLTNEVKRVFKLKETKVLTDDRKKETSSNPDPAQSSGTGTHEEQGKEEPHVPSRERGTEAGGHGDQEGERREEGPPKPE